MDERTFGLDKVKGLLKGKPKVTPEMVSELQTTVEKGSALAGLMRQVNWKSYQNVFDQLRTDYHKEAGRPNASLDQLAQTNGKLQALNELESRLDRIRVEALEADKQLRAIKEKERG